MMSQKPSLTRSQATEQVLAETDRLIALDELCQRVLAIWPSRARKPLGSMRSYLRGDEAGRSLVFLDAHTVLALPIAMRGVKFRVSLTRREAKRGALIIRPAFDHFLRRELDPAEVQLLDQKGRPLPVRPITIRMQANTLLGKQTIEHAAFDLSDWFRAQRVRRNDSVLVTVEDWTVGRFRLEHEASRHRRRKAVDQRDEELADLLFDMLEGARNEVIYTHMALPTAYARLSDPQGYPGSHFIDVVERDQRMRYGGWAIRYSDWRSPLEAMLAEEETLPEATFSPTQGRQVYRFKAALWHRPGLWRTIEIQGNQTLAELDGILRDAFEHDVSDHLGGFWKRVRRGRSKRFREIDLGDVDPLGEGTGTGVHIAGLDLEPTQELKYVYDFGDWIEHRLTLEKIVKPEAQVDYPRIIARNRPRHRDCQSCLAQGRKARATWVCLECSNQQQREVLVCENCLDREHDYHYAERILY